MAQRRPGREELPTTRIIMFAKTLGPNYRCVCTGASWNLP